MNVNVLVLCGFGINCERETAHAFERAGALAHQVHLNDLLAAPGRLAEAEILAVPGGFSFGDDVGSGRILANRLRYAFEGPLQEFVAAGKLVIGICNGFQVLVKMGILPLSSRVFRQETTLTHNDSNRFEDRWVTLAVDTESPCIWTRGIHRIELPVRHGEGKFVAGEGVLERLESQGQIVARYALPDGVPAHRNYPYNPNGSDGDVAALCDPSGRIFGLMPHPEAFIHRTNHPRWTREAVPNEGAGLAIFKNAVDYVRQAETLPHPVGGQA